MEDFQQKIWNDLSPAQIDFITVINKTKVRFIIIGGYAMRYLGSQRKTSDLDLLVNNDEKNIQNIASALKMLEFTNISKTIDHLHAPYRRFIWRDVDLITPNPSWDFYGFYSRVLLNEYNFLKFYFLSISDMIKLKKESNRDNDKEDLEFLKKLMSNNK